MRIIFWITIVLAVSGQSFLNPDQGCRLIRQKTGSLQLVCPEKSLPILRPSDENEIESLATIKCSISFNNGQLKVSCPGGGATGSCKLQGLSKICCTGGGGIGCGSNGGGGGGSFCLGMDGKLQVSGGGGGSQCKLQVEVSEQALNLLRMSNREKILFKTEDNGDIDLEDIRHYMWWE